MTDVLTRAQRSFNMSQIRSRNTRPETRLRSLLTNAGLTGFELHPTSIPGKPDFYFPSERFAVFVDGCFWHRCPTCFRMPSQNRAFWEKKISLNITRDRKVNKLLRVQGVTTLRIKEHEINRAAPLVIGKIREKIQQNRPTVLDLFAGAGGFSEGFVRAGCDIVGHIEMDRDACRTLVTRMIYHALLKRGKVMEYKKYVLGEVALDSLVQKYELEREHDSIICAEIRKDNFKRLIIQIRDKLGGRPLDIIIGGPPCQAYSYIGRARDHRNMKRDHRNFLYHYYVSFLKALKPKIFVFENVPGLETAAGGRHLRQMRRLMKCAGYDTDYRILDAVDFGIPQMRKRVILVGWNRNSGLRDYPDFPTVNREYKVGDFLESLPKLRSGEGRRLTRIRSHNRILEKLGIAIPDFGLLMDHVARPHHKRDLEIYRRAVAAKEKGENIKYNRLPSKLKTHKNESGFLDRYKVVDPNTDGSQTVVAHIAKDGHYYIHPDPKQNRSLTVREAARLQTFPDDYKFEGSRGSQFRQIGNAVPPLLSEIIANELVKHL